MFGFAVAASIAALSSAALACTVFKGQMTVSGRHGMSTAVGDPTKGMSYCSPPTPGAQAASGDTVTVSEAPSTACSSSVANQLADGVYDVNFVNGRAMATSRGSYTWVLDCMSPAGGRVVKVGDMTVSGGSGTAMVSLTGRLVPNRPGSDSAICVSAPNGSTGNQAPVSVIVV